MGGRILATSMSVRPNSGFLCNGLLIRDSLCCLARRREESEEGEGEGKELFDLPFVEFGIGVGKDPSLSLPEASGGGSGLALAFTGSRRIRAGRAEAEAEAEVGASGRRGSPRAAPLWSVIADWLSDGTLSGDSAPRAPIRLNVGSDATSRESVRLSCTDVGRSIGLLTRIQNLCRIAQTCFHLL